MNKSILTSIVLSLFCSIGLLAQPMNDECATAIDLGIGVNCPNPTVYTNVNATASVIASNPILNIPSCFNGGGTNRDVWFAFTAPIDGSITDFTISVNGTGVAGGIVQPQMAIYRGNCSLNNLDEIGCVSSGIGDINAKIDLLGLFAGDTYYIRINDYSVNATPNAGAFTLCVEEYVAAINIGSSPSSESCFGTLFDSGGPDASYGANENLTFTVCPNTFTSCIEINILDFNTENNFDALEIFAGATATGTPLFSLTGVITGGIPFQVGSSCVTFRFSSDGSVQNDGFQLEWSCNAANCQSSAYNPTVIPSLPYQNTSTTCDDASTFTNSPCNNDAFLVGAEQVYTFTPTIPANNSQCFALSLSNAAAGTGIAIFDGPPTDGTTNCVASGPNGMVTGIAFETGNTYYIVVASPGACTGFNLNIEPSDCLINASLASALCNPINGCLNPNGLPTVLNFQQGFQDMDVTDGVNDGCWGGVGVEPDFYWFSMVAQADGAFGFIMESAGAPSDIDYNVWGPFTQEQTCENPQFVIDFITNNQPIRSSYAGAGVPTGLADVHPIFGYQITDEYDCEGVGNQNNDQYVTTIPCTEGEVYIVLANDFGNEIIGAGMSINFGTSNPPVLDPLLTSYSNQDTLICANQSAQLAIDAPITSVFWIDPTNTLSCFDCPNPIATPTQTTVYQAVVDGICINDTIQYKVFVLDDEIELGPNRTLCLGQRIELGLFDLDPANVTVAWTAPTGLLSCTTCLVPTVIGFAPGTYNVTVTATISGCTKTDNISITVLPNIAPQYIIADNVNICQGTTVALGGPMVPGTNYAWTSTPVGFVDISSNPMVTPTLTTLYHLSVNNATCPFPVRDSVLVTVSIPPTINVGSNVSICQGDTVALSNHLAQTGVTYAWTPATGLIGNASDANVSASPTVTTTYRLVATRGACTVQDEITVTVTQNAVNIVGADTLLVCKGNTVPLTATVSPSNATVGWTPNNGTIVPPTGLNVVVTPTNGGWYFASTANGNCFSKDSVYIQVDSLPMDLAISPQDTTICEGTEVILKSPVYEPGLYPMIKHKWTPQVFQETPDSFYNLVVTPADTVTYTRTTTVGACVSVETTTVNVIKFEDLRIVPDPAEICPGSSIQLTLVSNVLDQLTDIEWTPEDNISCVDCLNPTVNPQTTTTFAVSANYLECPLGAAIEVVVLTEPSIGTPPAKVCQGETVTLNLAPNPNYTYNWASSTNPNFSSNLAAPTDVINSPSTYQVTVTDPRCGSKTFEFSIGITQQPNLSVAPQTSVCEGVPTNLVASAVEQGTYTWTLNGNVVGTGATFSPDVSVPGTFNYTVSFTDNGNCFTETVNTTLEVRAITLSNVPLPVGPAATICIGNTTQITATGTGAGTYMWDHQADLFDGMITVGPFSQEGMYTFTSTFTSTELCERQVGSVVIQVLPPFSIDSIWAVPDTLYEGEMVSLGVLTNPTSLDNPTYVWTQGPNSVDGNAANVTAITPEVFLDIMTEGTDVPYMVVITDEIGCRDEAEVLVFVQDLKFEIPLAFSPNNDAINGLFAAITKGPYEIADFKIYNRWGKKVYDITDADANQEGWDGNYKDKPAPIDVYGYYMRLLRPDGKEEIRKGEVTLIR